MIAQTLAVATLAASAAAGWTSKTGSCNTGQISCCDTNKKAQKSTGEESGLLHTGDVLDQVAIQCDQIPVLAIAIEDECKNVSETLNINFDFSNLNTS